MTKNKVTVTRVLVNDSVEFPYVSFWIDKPLQGFTNDADEGGTVTRTEGDITKIDIARSKLTRQLCEADELIAEYRGSRTTAFGQKEFNRILMKAELTIVSERHSAGDEVPDTKDADGNPVTYKLDGYDYTVVGIKMTERAIARIDKACEL